MAADRVVVTGASGFVAQHCIIELLRAGFRVTGTLRDIARGEAIRSIIGAHAEAGSRLSFAEAELLADTGWNESLRGARYVLHVASPVPATLRADAESIIGPARAGTLRVLRAAARSGVERVVLTSSVSAIIFRKDARDGRTLTEEDWSTAEGLSAYDRSKVLAERDAWEFVTSSPEGRELELVAINPGLVLGPVLSRETGASAEVVRKLLAGEVPGCPRVGWAPVDVRDVASAHVAAMLTPAARGRRYICALEHVWMVEIARILADHFAHRGYPVKTRTLPDWLVRLCAKFDASMALVSRKLGRPVNVSSQRIREQLGWAPRQLNTSIIDMGESLIAHGVV